MDLRRSEGRSLNIVSVPSAVHTDYFKWQLEFLWYGHQKQYGDKAKDKLFAVIAKRNHPQDEICETLKWETSAPHVMVDSFFDHFKEDKRVVGSNAIHQPINIPLAALAACNHFDDDVVLEVMDCDLVHFKPHPDIEVKDDSFIVWTSCENWFLKSLSDHKYMMDIYTGGKTDYYLGGFVPIVGKVRTFKKILPDWFDILLHMNTLQHTKEVMWWNCMYAFNAACERQKVTMIDGQLCYVPAIDPIKPTNYIAHYSCDSRFHKYSFPNINTGKFLQNEFYGLAHEWLNSKHLAR